MNRRVKRAVAARQLRQSKGWMPIQLAAPHRDGFYVLCKEDGQYHVAYYSCKASLEWSLRVKGDFYPERFDRLGQASNRVELWMQSNDERAMAASEGQ
jgi:hypothetical protein